MSAEERAKVLRAYAGERTNRRHRPGRAFERTFAGQERAAANCRKLQPGKFCLRGRRRDC